MSILDGTTVIWDGQIHATNVSDISTGVLTLVLTPAGGTGALPALVAGQPGLPPVIDSVVVNNVAPGTTLPAPVWNLVSPGGPGVASHYTLTLSVFQGQTGLTGPSTNVLGAPDVDTTTVAPTDKYILAYSQATGKMTFTTQKAGGLFVPGSLNSTSGNQTSRTLGSVTIPARPNAFRVIPKAQTIVNGTANTTVDLVCRIANANTGQQCGYGLGLPGPVDRVTLIDVMPPGSVTGYATIPAGQPAAIFLQAEQQNAAVTDSWTTAASRTLFQVTVQDIP